MKILIGLLLLFSITACNCTHENRFYIKEFQSIKGDTINSCYTIGREGSIIFSIHDTTGKYKIGDEVKISKK